MVNSFTFYQLNYPQQADLLLTEGTFLQSRNEDNFVVDLYELHELLVEVYYQQEAEELVSLIAYNTAEKLRTFSRQNIAPRLIMKTPAERFSTHTENYAA